MEPVRLWIPGPPGRKRHNTNRWGTQAYKDIKAQSFEARIAAIAMTQDLPLFQGPVELGVQAIYRHRGEPLKTKRRQSEWKTSKPDLKNIIASVEDALTGIVWHDDSQVCSYYACCKIRGQQGQPEGTLLLVRALGSSPHVIAQQSPTNETKSV